MSTGVFSVQFLLVEASSVEQNWGKGFGAPQREGNSLLLAASRTHAS